MRKISIKSLDIKNFKGVEKFQVSMNGAGVSIYGDNATGKTTVYDAFLWLLFGKDSLNNATFEIKPTKNPSLEVTVEAVFEIDETRLSFKKVYVEKWTKKRGTAKAEFTGHQVDHFIDGVPSKKKEFDAAIDDLCPEDIFRLLTNPRYFNEVLHWSARRKSLLEICGDITDADVIASDKALVKLPAILKSHNLDNYRKIIKARLPEINREIQKIPVRIDEITASRADTSRSIEKIQKDIEKLKANRKGFTDQLTQIESGGEIAAIQGQIAKINTKILEEKNRAGEINRKVRDQHNKENDALMREVIKVENDLVGVQRSVRVISGDIKGGWDRIKTLEDQMESLRKQWTETDAMAFEFTQDSVCPTCKQPLPEDQVEDARRIAQERHNAAKAQMLAEVSTKGKAAKKQAEELQTEVEQLQERLAVAEADLDSMTKAKEDATAAVKAHNATTPRLVEVDVSSEEKAKAKLISQINALKEGSASGATAVKVQIAGFDADIDACNKELLAHESSKRITARVEELKKQERELAAEYERLEGELHLTEQFVRSKVALLEDSINAKFKLAKWKLFNELINGGLEETCTMTVDGVPYGSLNNAMRINAGIECCNVLSEHYGIALPCFADNAEAVTDLLPSVGQQIKLVVSAKDSVLRVE